VSTILSGFLSANLLPIGEDDEKLKLLEASSADLAAEIEATPLIAFRFALVGLDERVSADDPVHKSVATTIANHWQTMTNKTGVSPVQVHRAVILRALEIVADKNPDIRHAIVLIAKNLGPVALDGKSKDATASMIERFQSAVTAELNEAWVDVVRPEIANINAKPKGTEAIREALTSGFGRAAGPHDKDAKPYPTPNPHWPNSGNPWSYDFAPRAAEAVSAALQTSMQGLGEEMRSSLQQTLGSWAKVIQQLAIRDAKTELLWIRASMYSPSAQAGYKSIDSMKIVLHAALDVSRVVNKLSPPSVEFFVRDLVGGLTDRRARTAKLLSAIGAALAELPEGAAISHSETLPKEGRRSWLDCAVRGFESKQFEAHTGLPSNHEESLADLAVHLYREMHIRKLLIVAK
jgi:hypothetical protein